MKIARVASYVSNHLNFHAKNYCRFLAQKFKSNFVKALRTQFSEFFFKSVFGGDGLLHHLESLESHEEENSDI